VPRRQSPAPVANQAGGQCTSGTRSSAAPSCAAAQRGRFHAHQATVERSIRFSFSQHVEARVVRDSDGVLDGMSHLPPMVCSDGVCMWKLSSFSGKAGQLARRHAPVRLRVGAHASGKPVMDSVCGSFTPVNCVHLVGIPPRMSAIADGACESAECGKGEPAQLNPCEANNSFKPFKVKPQCGALHSLSRALASSILVVHVAHPQQPAAYLRERSVQRRQWHGALQSGTAAREIGRPLRGARCDGIGRIVRPAQVALQYGHSAAQRLQRPSVGRRRRLGLGQVCGSV
jgi:hypothetical protein